MFGDYRVCLVRLHVRPVCLGIHPQLSPLNKKGSKIGHFQFSENFWQKCHLQYVRRAPTPRPNSTYHNNNISKYAQPQNLKLRNRRTKHNFTLSIPISSLIKNSNVRFIDGGAYRQKHLRANWLKSALIYLKQSYLIYSSQNPQNGPPKNH